MCLKNAQTCHYNQVKFRQRTPAHFYVFIKIDKTDKDLTSRNGAGRISSQTRILPRFSGFKSNNNKQEKKPEADVFVRLCGPCQIDHTTSIRKHVGVEGLHGREIGF